jgi:hypothetical protein
MRKTTVQVQDYSTNNVFSMLNTLLLSDILRLSMTRHARRQRLSTDVISLGWKF